MERIQMKQAFHYNKTAKDLPVLHEGDTVRMKPFQLGEKKWGKAVVNRRLDERSYEVETNIGTTDETESTYESQMRHLQEYAKDQIKQAMIERRDAMIQRRDAMIQRRDAIIEWRDAMIERRDAMIQRRDTMIERRYAMIQWRDVVIQRRDAMIQ